MFHDFPAKLGLSGIYNLQWRAMVNPIRNNEKGIEHHDGAIANIDVVLLHVSSICNNTWLPVYTLSDLFGCSAWALNTLVCSASHAVANNARV